jgi:hypothetical protein
LCSTGREGRKPPKVFQRGDFAVGKWSSAAKDLRNLKWSDVELEK